MRDPQEAPVWFDSHCHLHLCTHDVAAAIVARARGAGVVQMVTVGIDIASSRTALDLAAEHGVYATAGLHPNSATEWAGDVREQLELLLDNELVVGVGETGLDYYRDDATPEEQAQAFDGHIELAKRYDKALVIHTRESVAAALDQLEARGAPNRVIFHCWSGSEDELRRALALGAYVSFAGNVSFRNAESLRAAARSVPSERLLVETDSPFLSPEPLRGRPNEPANVVHVATAVAAARVEEPLELARAMTTNARAVYGLSG